MTANTRQSKGFYGRWYGRKVRPQWWSFVNWLKGYKFGPVQRFRCCDHTTPFHYGWCARNTAEKPVRGRNAAEWQLPT